MSRILVNACHYFATPCFGRFSFFCGIWLGRENWSPTLLVFQWKEVRMVALKSPASHPWQICVQPILALCQQPVPLCTLREGSKKQDCWPGLLLGFDLFSDHITPGQASTLSPSSTEMCQTPEKRMYSNEPETPTCELINTLQRCQLPGRSLESLTAACQCAGLWICTEKTRFIQPECDPDSVPCVPCCPKPVWESEVAVLLCIKCTINTVSLCRWCYSSSLLARKGQNTSIFFIECHQSFGFKKIRRY